MSNTTNKFSFEVPALAVRMVLDHEGDQSPYLRSILVKPAGIKVNVISFSPGMGGEQSWRRLSEQFPAKDKWRSAGFGS